MRAMIPSRRSWQWLCITTASAIHMNRMRNSEVELQKSNILLIGPTGRVSLDGADV